MEVTVTFDTSIPEDRNKLENLFTSEELSEAAELSATETESSESLAFTFDDEEGSKIDGESSMADSITLGGGIIHLRFSHGGLSRHGEVAQFLLDNPWSTAREIADEMEWGMKHTNSVLTSKSGNTLFVSKEPQFRDVPNGGYVWSIVPAAYPEILDE